MIDNNDKTLKNTYVALSKLITAFNLDLNGFCKGLRKQHVMDMHKSSNTVVRTALRAGMDRRTVTNIIKNKKQRHKPPFLSTILNQIETVAKNNEMLVKKRGTDSVESMMQEVAPGATTLRAIILELLALDCIEDEGTKIRFIANKFNIIPKKRKALNTFSAELTEKINQMLQEYDNKRI